MAEKKAKKGGKNYCVAGGPNGINCENRTGTKNIKMHYFPNESKLRDKWTRFVRIHRRDFLPKKSSCLCSAHFDESCYRKQPILVEKEGKSSIEMDKKLIPGSIPSKDTVVPYTSPLTERKRRREVRNILLEHQNAPKPKNRRKLFASSLHSTCTETSSTVTDATGTAVSAPSALVSDPVPEVTPPAVDTCSLTTQMLSTRVPVHHSVKETRLGAKGSSCKSCDSNKRKKQALNRKFYRLKVHCRNLEAKVKELQHKESQASESDSSDTEISEKTNEDKDINEESGVTNWAPDESSAPSSEEYSTQSEEELDGIDTSNTVRVDPDTPYYEEPKFIVFFTQLLGLFSLLCFKCKDGKPRVTMEQRGTMVTVKQHCHRCGEESYIWKSQPMVFNGRYPAGNIMLSFSILMAGASISKMLLVFKHFGLFMFTARTFFFHQKNFLFPAIVSYWEEYQAALIQKISNLQSVVWSGDGRFDSMGHSAKFGVYTMFCNTILKVVHFELLQANETGGSTQMELEGAKRAFAYLQSVGLTIAVFISDRHRGIAKWVRENCKGCAHFYDIWHIARSITKKLIKLGKEKHCEKIGDWVKAVRNHLYWCAMSTKQGFGEMIVEKWKSFMFHVANKHTNHPSDLFKKCAHGEIDDRRWIKIGTTAYTKLHKVIINTALINDIKKLSPDSQTSCLEGLHSTLNHWHPKMVCFSWLGTFCRHILASLHFNENLKRETKKSEKGEEYLRVIYPKFKLGEEIVRQVPVSPTYGYVDDIRKELLCRSREELKSVSERYFHKIPKPLSTQFPDRHPKSVAVVRYQQRQEQEETKLYPIGEKQVALQTTHSGTVAPKQKTRRPPKCRSCGHPMQGHDASACKSTED